LSGAGASAMALAGAAAWVVAGGLAGAGVAIATLVSATGAADARAGPVCAGVLAGAGLVLALGRDASRRWISARFSAMRGYCWVAGDACSSRILAPSRSPDCICDRAALLRTVGSSGFSIKACE